MSLKYILTKKLTDFSRIIFPPSSWPCLCHRSRHWEVFIVYSYLPKASIFFLGFIIFLDFSFSLLHHQPYEEAFFENTILQKDSLFAFIIYQSYSIGGND